MNISTEALAVIRQMQQNELTESIIYEKIASFAKGDENKKTLMRLAKEEHAHYEIWKRYTSEEMKEFNEYVSIAVDAMFEHEPFRTFRNKFNIVAVESASAESGVSVPKDGLWKNTAFSSHFSTFYSDRYLTTLHLKDVHNALAGIPYEHIIILANSDEYGGGGIYNSYNMTSTKHKWYRPVVVHEFGHSFAGLGDEYEYGDENHETYPLDIEPWEKNITTKVDPEKAARVGKVEGGGYSTTGVFRAYEDCRMRTNQNPEFCPICCEAIADIIKFYTE